MDVADIDTHLVVLLRLHATRESHRLSLHTTEGTESVDGLDTLVSRQNGWERAVGIVLELFDGHATAEATTTRQLTRMIEEIRMSFIVGNTTMVGKRLRVAQRHDDSCIFPRAYRRRCRAVRDVFRHTTSSIQQLVHAFPLGQPRTFDIRVLILLALLTLAHHRTAKGFLGHVKLTQFAAIGNHVAVQLQVIALRITPHEPSLSVVVNQHGRVDMVPRAVLKQGLANGVAERSRRRVADSHTDGHSLRQPGMGTDVPVELTIALDTLRSPGTVVSPREALQGQR